MVTQFARYPYPYPSAPLEIPIAMQPIPVESLLTTKQAAAMLGIAIATLKKWRQRPCKGPDFVKFPNGTIRYRLTAVKKFIQFCTVKQ